MFFIHLQGNPPVGKDHPPDLAALVPSGSINLPDQPEKQPSSQVLTDGNHVSVDNESKAISGENLFMYPQAWKHFFFGCCNYSTCFLFHCLPTFLLGWYSHRGAYLHYGFLKHGVFIIL